MSLVDFAIADERGKKTDKPLYPYSLTFKAHEDVKNLFPNEVDVKAHGAPDLLTQLESIPEDATLYNVYATEKPDA